VTEVSAQALRTATPGAQNKEAVDLVEAQEKLLRFADEFSTRMAVGIASQLARANQSKASTASSRTVFTIEPRAAPPGALSAPVDSGWGRA